MMNPFVMKGIGKVGFMEKPIAEDPGPTGAIIKTTRALVCTSDTHTVADAIGDRKGLILGHEAVGVVYRLGSEVKGVREGDRVAVNAITPCYGKLEDPTGFFLNEITASSNEQQGKQKGGTND